MTTEKYDIRKRGEIEVLKAFLYKTCIGDCLSVHLYDKITKKVYAGNIHLSSYKKEEIQEKKKQKEFKVWVEFERIIEADSQDDAEVIFGDELKIEDIIINSQEVKDDK